MRKILWAAAALAMFGVLGACGDDEEDPPVVTPSGGSGGSDTDGGTGGTTGGTGGGDGGTGGTTGGTGGGDGGTGGGDGGTGGETGGTGGDGGDGGAGGAGDCTGLAPANDCGACLETNCCADVVTCDGATGCMECLFGDDTSCSADNQTAVETLFACAETSCDVECISGPTVEADCEAPATAASTGACVTVAGAIECNPVTNEPCAAGEACDVNETGDGYVCWPPPPANDKLLCEECSSSLGFCEGTMTCVGTCARYCCDDTDCGANGTCDKDSFILAGGVGVCLAVAAP